MSFIYCNKAKLFTTLDRLTLLSQLIVPIILCVTCAFLFVACGPRFQKPSFHGQWHTVKAGDTLNKISQKYKVDIQDLIEANQLQDASKIKVKQTLFIPNFYVPSTARTVLLFKGNSHKQIKDEDENEEQAYLEEQNNKQTPPTTSTQAYTSDRFVQQMRALRWPLTPVTVTSAFGQRNKQFHQGIDLRASQGSKVYAVLDGVVSRSDYDADGYGWYIIIQHKHGLETCYAHHRKNRVKVGQVVKQGQHIADTGSSGKSTAPHLHFEIRIANKRVDPLIYLPAIQR